jgi:hypothetical protein
MLRVTLELLFGAPLPRLGLRVFYEHLGQLVELRVVGGAIEVEVRQLCLVVKLRRGHGLVLRWCYSLRL